jgi:hypothetical protein
MRFILLQIRRLRYPVPGFVGTPVFAAGACFVVALLIHLPFVIYPGFGEQDAARIAIIATYGHATGQLEVSYQWAFSCPLYIHFLYVLLQWDLVSTPNLAKVMALTSLFAGALFTSALFLFLFNATRSRLVAVVSVVLAQLSPAHFFSSIYGFPSIVALALFTTAAVALQAAVCARYSRTTTCALYGLFLLLYVASVATKVDVIMASTLFCLPVHQKRRGVRAQIVAMAGLALLALLVFWAVNRYGLTVSTHDSASRHWESWSSRFYQGVGSLFTIVNLHIIGGAAGMLTIPVALAAAILMIVKKVKAKPVLWITLTAFPLMIWWGSMGGNSARHNLIPAIFVNVLTALPLALENRRFKMIWGAGLVFMAILNYFYYAPLPSPNNPSGRLMASAALLKERVHHRAWHGRRIAKGKHRKILIEGNSFKYPHYFFEILASDRLRFERKVGDRLIMRHGDKRKVFLFPRSKRKDIREQAKKQGFKVVRI